MNYTRRSSFPVAEVYPERGGYKKGRVMSKACRREYFKAKGNQPSFRCPDCRERFQLAYGNPCKRGVFGDAPWYCKDCQEKDPTLHRT